MPIDSCTAAVCGLFCGTCSMFPNDCHGCLSDMPAAHCHNCPHGFRKCAKEHGVTRCFECETFPCERLEKFLDSHWENGISHHATVIDDLQRMQAVGVDAWVEERSQQARCPRCGKLIPWHKRDCGCSS